MWKRGTDAFFGKSLRRGWSAPEKCVCPRLSVPVCPATYWGSLGGFLSLTARWTGETEDRGIFSKNLRRVWSEPEKCVCPRFRRISCAVKAAVDRQWQYGGGGGS